MDIRVTQEDHKKNQKVDRFYVWCLTLVVKSKKNYGSNFILLGGTSFRKTFIFLTVELNVYRPFLSYSQT